MENECFVKRQSFISFFMSDDEYSNIYYIYKCVCVYNSIKYIDN